MPLPLSSPQPAGRLQSLWFLPFVVLAVSLCVTVFFWRMVSLDNEEATMVDFQQRVAISAHRIQARLSHCETMLLGGAGLFAANHEVTRRDWLNYVTALRPERTLDGVQGFGFAEAISPEGLPAHEASIRKEGFPQYSVSPAYPREYYSAIVYLEPFSGRNLRAFGYDMYSEPVRRQAMERARDEERTILSGRVTLVQEIPGLPTQSGFLIYTPVYWPGRPHASLEQRRRALRGWVYSPFRAGDFIEKSFRPEHSDIGLEVYDGDVEDAEHQLYASGESYSVVARRITMRIDVLGRPWRLVFRALPAFEESRSRMLAKLLLASGFVASILASGGALLLVGRFRAMARQRQAEGQLAKALGRLQRLSDNLPLGYVFQVLSDPSGQRRFSYMGASFSKVHGLPSQDPLDSAARFYELIHQEDVRLLKEREQEALAHNAPLAIELRMRCISGSWHWMRLVLAPQVLDSGLVQWDGLALDVDESHRLMEQIIADARIKSELLAEVNHRVTNNLTSILALVAAEMDAVSEDKRPCVTPSLLRLGQRIRGLLSAHRMLSDNRWAPLPISRLASTVIRAAIAANPDLVETELVVENSHQLISPRQASSLALVFNELATNSVKYARVPTQPLCIQVSIQEDGAAVEIHYSDNGPGFAGSLQVSPSSGMGLRLIRQLVSETLRGTLEFHSGPGARVTLSLRLEDRTRT